MEKTFFSQEEVKKMFDRYNEFIVHHKPSEWNDWINLNKKNKMDKPTFGHINIKKQITQ